MADKIWYIVMVPMVYVSLAWCLIWTVVRIVGILRAPNMPPTLRIFPEGKGPEDPPAATLAGAIWDALSMPTLLARNPRLWFILVVFHVSMFILILAHIDILPQINIMPANSEHMIGNGAVGILITLCTLYLLFRRFVTPVREVSVPADYLLLVLLLAVMVTGDMISWGNSWSESGFVITKKDLGAYFNSLLQFSFEDPRNFLSGSHYALVGIHILLANAFLLVLPFSKIVHAFFAIPLNKLRRG
jgi:nitrate reductase gamma subunit